MRADRSPLGRRCNCAGLELCQELGDRICILQHVSWCLGVRILPVFPPTYVPPCVRDGWDGSRGRGSPRIEIAFCEAQLKLLSLRYGHRYLLYLQQNFLVRSVGQRSLAIGGGGTGGLVGLNPPPFLRRFAILAQLFVNVSRNLVKQCNSAG